MTHLQLSGQIGDMTWVATNHDLDVLERFYVQYDRIFTLDDEKETKEGFETLLDIQHNKNALALAKYGHFEEWFVVFEMDGRDVGGINFSVMPVRGNIQSGPAVGIHSSYGFLCQTIRGSGRSQNMFKVAREIAARHKGNQFMLFEMNDAMKMPVPLLRQDMDASGIHPVDRWAVSTSWGAKALCFPYIQPALCTKSKGEDSLVLFTMEIAPLSAIHLQQHLETFFNLSVLKGADCRLVPEAESQLEQCRILANSHITAKCLRPHLHDLRVMVDGRLSEGGVGKGMALSDWLMGRSTN